MKVYNISLYVKVQIFNYETALLGIRMSMNCKHRIWYIFLFLKKFECIPIVDNYTAGHDKRACKL